ncbi:NAD(P)-dependent oxidoreductase [Paenibacillus sp. BC26]|uniref:SDR family oxidoreductase n=1 Tax=Paenibacillus sp. BC26 TaxID=1881032 RepID=UPI0008EA2697|nr:NAD(P)-dependent oxidoreductase [Paenibacillus sp. BC26]SFS88146.1 dTDP-4-dehydrorhamnose reductase [Paenibacillus sp. BC26]
MNIMITGAVGQLGRDLLRVLGQGYTYSAFTGKELDICDLKAVKKTVGEVKPDVVIHAAAYSRADQAEEAIEQAYRLHALGVSHLAIAAEAAGAKLVHVSTDYVFDGTKGEPHGELDRTISLTVYGQSKLLGEQFVQAVCPRHFIVRASMLSSNDGTNFVTKILPLAECIGRLITTERYGTYHVSNCSKAALEDIFRTDRTHSDQRGGIAFE